MNGYFNYRDELYHHGVKGMKWGVRHSNSKTKRKRNNKNTINKGKIIAGTIIGAASIAGAIYLLKDPMNLELVHTGANAVARMFSKGSKTIASSVKSGVGNSIEKTKSAIKNKHLKSSLNKSDRAFYKSIKKSNPGLSYKDFKKLSFEDLKNLSI